MNKLDAYLINEAEKQFSTEKRMEIEFGEDKVGKSKLSENLSYELQKAKEYARTHGINVKSCSWCQSPAFVSNVRANSAPLCDKCEGARPEIEYRLKVTKQVHLTPQDAVKVANSRTVSRGPYWSPNNPNAKPGGKTPRPRENF